MIKFVGIFFINEYTKLLFVDEEGIHFFVHRFAEESWVYVLGDKYIDLEVTGADNVSAKALQVHNENR